MKLIAAILLAERKSQSQHTAYPVVEQIPEVDQVYLNIECSLLSTRFNWLMDRVEQSAKPTHYDMWRVHDSTWRTDPEYDQDQRRLLGIVTARNMAIDYALAANATHLLFVDADVKPHEGSVKKLIDLDLPLCGGYVPGRGSHSHVHYVFGKTAQNGSLIECDHGTCGFMLIKREVFGQLRFRWGDDWRMPNNFLSEDPAYCLDWFRISGQRFIIQTEATADHIGDLAPDQVAVDNWSIFK